MANKKTKLKESFPSLATLNFCNAVADATTKVLNNDTHLEIVLTKDQRDSFVELYYLMKEIFEQWYNRIKVR